MCTNVTKHNKQKLCRTSILMSSPLQSFGAVSPRPRSTPLTVDRFHLRCLRPSIAKVNWQDKVPNTWNAQSLWHDRQWSYDSPRPASLGWPSSLHNRSHKLEIMRSVLTSAGCKAQLDAQGALYRQLESQPKICWNKSFCNCHRET